LTGDLGRMRGDGCVEHLGRMDTRIKIRGQAVELAEVEAALRSIDQVAEAAVVVLDDEAGQSELVAYIVVNDEPEPTVSKLRRLLAKTLAPYAIPARYVTLEALPLSAAGKLDRRALPQPQKSRPALDNPFARNYGLAQLRLRQIWEDLLQLEPVGITDDFFDLGGHSLLAVQMMDQIQREFGQRLSPTLLVSGATIGHLSQALARQTRAPQMVALQAEGSRPPFYFLHGDYISGGVYCRHLVQHLNQEQPLFAISPYGLDGDAVPPTYQEMARQHLEAIRAHRPNGPYRLGGVCNGGLIALEIARLLREHGESVECLLLIQASAANLRFANLWRRVDRLAGLFGAVPESRDTLFWRLRRLALVLEALPVQKRLIFFLSKIPKVPVRLLEFFGGRKGVEPAVDSGATNLETIFHHIDEIYIPSRYPHPVTLIWGSDELEPPEEAAKYWRRLGADVELHILPGLHTDALTKHVEQLAIQIQALLDG
jgi:acyl carrier protein